MADRQRVRANTFRSEIEPVRRDSPDRVYVINMTSWRVGIVPRRAELSGAEVEDGVT